MATVIRPLTGFGNLSEAEITALEGQIGHKLPIEYRSFLLAHNGGRPEKKLFLINNGTEESVVSEFFGLKTDYIPSEIEIKDIRWRLDNYQNRIPAHLFPFGADQGDNLLCISLVDGTIYYWDHEGESEEDESPTLDNIAPVARSLSEFLDSLSAWPPEDES